VLNSEESLYLLRLLLVLRFYTTLDIARENTLKGNPKGVGTTQDDATTAWNLCTALYYKSSNNSIPWKLKADHNKPLTCYVGISFYRSRDKTVVYSSLAQIFDEMGRNIILRGTPVKTDKEDLKPYLDSTQAYDLVKSAVNEYRIAMNTNPARLVIHKTSHFHKEEIEGVEGVSEDLRIQLMDMISINDSNIRLFRRSSYPPYRGSMIRLDSQNKYLLYTRGSVPFFQTYPGKYIPQPLEIQAYRSESSPNQICEEILALTKMNWNNTQFDRKYPITIECARNVGKIVKYLDPTETPQANYRFYM
jgi:argonaute-like protein implicated in RNA metabolism and viral defense